MDAFYGWSSRKAQFTREQIGIAVDQLRGGGWLDNAGASG